MAKTNIVSLVFLLISVASHSATQEKQHANKKYINHSTSKKVNKFRKKSIGEYQHMAKRGDPHAQYKLGLIFSLGKGIERDYITAYYWFKHSAYNKHHKAQYYLGMLYANGRGTKKNKSLAAKWYRAAALSGFAPAQYSMGLMYFYGYDNVSIDKIKAYAWLNISAAKGHYGAREFLESLEKTMSIEEINTAQSLSLAKL